MPSSKFQDKVNEELAKIRKVHGRVASHHEGYALLKEELEEYWDQVKLKDEKRDKANMLHELIQIAAVCERCAVDLGLMP